MPAIDANAANDPNRDSVPPSVSHLLDDGPKAGEVWRMHSLTEGKTSEKALDEESMQIDGSASHEEQTRRVHAQIKRLEQLPLAGNMPGPLPKGLRSTLRTDCFRWLTCLNAAGRSKAWADHGVAYRRRLVAARPAAVIRLKKVDYGAPALKSMSDDEFVRLLLCAMSAQAKHKYRLQVLRWADLKAVLATDHRGHPVDEWALLSQNLKGTQVQVDEQCRILAEAATDALELTLDLPPMELSVKCLWVLLRLRLVAGKRPNNIATAFRRVAAQIAVAAGLTCTTDQAVMALYAALWRGLGDDPEIGIVSDLSVLLKRSGASSVLSPTQAGRRGRASKKSSPKKTPPPQNAPKTVIQVTPQTNLTPFAGRAVGALSDERQQNRVRRLLQLTDGFAVLCGRSFVRAYLDATDLQVNERAKPIKWHDLLYVPTKQWLAWLRNELDAANPLQSSIALILKGLELGRMGMPHDSKTWWLDLEHETTRLPGPFHLGNTKANIDFIELRALFDDSSTDRALEIIRCSELGRSLADVISSAPSNARSASFAGWRSYLLEQNVSHHVKASLTVARTMEPARSSFAATLFDPGVDALVSALG